jgi:hypothetical protein
VTVTAIGDSVADGNKTVILSLSGATGGVALDPGTQTVTIIDDDGPGTLALTAPASSQIAETGGSTTVQVTRTSGSSGSVGATIDIAGTAGAGERTVSPTMVSFANGDTAPKTVTVTAIGDSVADGNKTVILSLSSPTGGVALDPGTQTVTIIDTPPQSQPQPPASPTQSIATGQRATALKKCKKKKKTARARRKCRKKAKLLPL